MERRCLLSKFGVLTAGGLSAVAGCVNSVGSNQNDLAISAISGNADSDAVAVLTEIREGNISQQTQGKVEVGIRWDGSTTTRLRFGNVVPLSSPTQSSDSGDLILSDVEGDVTRKSERSWIADKDSLQSELVATTMEFKSGESRSNDYLLWGNPNRVEFLGAGNYEFEGSIKQTESNEIISLSISLEIVEG